MTALLSEVTVEKEMVLVVEGIVELDSDADVLFVVTVWVAVVSALVVALDPSDVPVVDSFNWDAVVVVDVVSVVVGAKKIIYENENVISCTCMFIVYVYIFEDFVR